MWCFCALDILKTNVTGWVFSYVSQFDLILLPMDPLRCKRWIAVFSTVSSWVHIFFLTRRHDRAARPHADEGMGEEVQLASKLSQYDIYMSVPKFSLCVFPFSLFPSMDSRTRQLAGHYPCSSYPPKPAIVAAGISK